MVQGSDFTPDNPCYRHDPNSKVVMRIGELARQTDVNVQTLRYYERRGLLPAAKRLASGYREYSAESVRLVRFIKRAQELGFSLRDVAELLELRGSNERSCDSVRAAAVRKRADVTERIRRLTTMQTALDQLTAACESAPSGRCPILDALNDAEA